MLDDYDLLGSANVDMQRFPGVSGPGRVESDDVPITMFAVAALPPTLVRG